MYTIYIYIPYILYINQEAYIEAYISRSRKTQEKVSKII